MFGSFFKKILKTAVDPYGTMLGAITGAANSKMPKAPTAGSTETTVPTMPTPDDAAVLEAKKRALAAQMARGGRASTILSDPSQTLGG